MALASWLSAQQEELGHAVQADLVRCLLQHIRFATMRPGSVVNFWATHAWLRCGVGSGSFLIFCLQGYAHYYNIVSHHSITPPAPLKHPPPPHTQPQRM